MYKLISFTYMFQIIYESFKCRLNFVQSAFIHTEFCVQKNKVKAFICCCFSIMPEKNKWGLIENLAQFKLFSFKHISNLTQRGWTCSHWHRKCKIVSFCKAKIAYIVPDHSHALQNRVSHTNSIANLCLKPS